MGLDGVELVIAIEKRFGIAIADSEAEKIGTPRELTDFIVNKLQVTNPKLRAMSAEEVAVIVRAIVIQHTGVEETQYSPNLHFAKDFGL